MKHFTDIVKGQPGASSTHVSTALGNSSNSGYKFGRNRSQPKRNKKIRDFNRVMAGTSKATMAKFPDYGLKDQEANGDIVRASKSDFFGVPLDIRKTDPDKQLIFGWASVVEKDGVAVIDKQGDVIPVEELENAAYQYTLDSRNGGDMHARSGVAKLVESMVFTKDKQEALGVDIGQIGWWVGFKVNDDALWSAHKRGERPEFSIGGQAVPVEIESITKRKLGIKHADKKKFGWIGVDLDGTLCKIGNWKGKTYINDPIPLMLNRVKQWLNNGRTVKIFTARVSNPKNKDEVTTAIQDWLEKYGLPRLDVTNCKDFSMTELWDDKAVQVIVDTGKPVR